MAEDADKVENTAGAADISKKSSKKKRKRNAKPKPGDPDYKTPTQLRNARKRRKKKEDKTAAVSGSNTNNESSGSRKDGQSQVVSHLNNVKDPSLKYLSNPRAAPTVRNAIKFFREKTNAEAGTNHDTYFPVTVGPKLGWRTVARLAVQQLSVNGKTKAKLRIGLFVPGSHDLLPVPDCPVHHRRINGLVKVLEDECNDIGIPAFVAGEVNKTNTNELGLRYVAIAIERSTQKQQLVLVWKEEANKSDEKCKLLDNLVKRLTFLSNDKNKKDISLHSVWVHYNNAWKHANSIFDREGRWETKFVDDGNNDESNVSVSDSLKGSIREVMLPSTNKREKDQETGSASNKIYVPLYFPPQVFRQANLDGFANIISRIREWLHEQQSKDTSVKTNNSFLQDTSSTDPPKRKRRRGRKDTSNQQQQTTNITTKSISTSMKSLGHCLELYGGVGTIGLNLVDLFDSIESSDENPFNEKCFHATADEILINKEPLVTSVRKKIAYTSKSASDVVVDDYQSLKKARVVIVDPPRKGLDPPVIEALCSDYQHSSNEDQALVYVSCGFDAFRRDYGALVEESGKWTLDRAEGHVLFPGSDAIETLAFFTRRK